VEQRGRFPPNFWKKKRFLCFERRFSKQKSVIRLKSNILSSPKFFGHLQIFGLATPLLPDKVNFQFFVHCYEPSNKHKATPNAVDLAMDLLLSRPANTS